MARYNSWMNRRLYDVCAALDDDARKVDHGAPFRSIHGTLNHNLLGDLVWMGRFEGAPIQVTSLGQELYSDFHALRDAREATDHRIELWAAGLTEQALAADLRYLGISPPEPRCYPTWFAVQHFFNHQTHHRGQLTTLLEQLGCDFGVTDLIALGPAT